VRRKKQLGRQSVIKGPIEGRDLGVGLNNWYLAMQNQPFTPLPLLWANWGRRNTSKTFHYFPPENNGQTYRLRALCGAKGTAAFTDLTCKRWTLCKKCLNAMKTSPTERSQTDGKS
jgi:hypothetical protein